MTRSRWTPLLFVLLVPCLFALGSGCAKKNTDKDKDASAEKDDSKKGEVEAASAEAEAEAEDTSTKVEPPGTETGAAPDVNAGAGSGGGSGGGGSAPAVVEREDMTCDPGEAGGCLEGETCIGSQGCEETWECDAEITCKKGVREYCGCDGRTFEAVHGNCPWKKYAYPGPCK